MHKFLTVIVAIFILGSSAFAEERGLNGEVPAQHDDHDDYGPVQIGWATISSMTVTTSATTSAVTVTTAATTGGASGLVVFATFGFKRGDETTQAGLLPSNLTTNALMFVNANGKLSRNMGIGIVNPNNAAASLTMTLRNEDGGVIGTAEESLHPRRSPDGTVHHFRFCKQT